MHELSVATALVESLQKYALEHNVKISCANISVGMLSGIDPEALKFAWEPALANHPDSRLENCRLQIKQPLLKHCCTQCKKVFELKTWQIECPDCQTETLRRESGSEFLLESIEVEDV